MATKDRVASYAQRGVLIETIEDRLSKDLSLVRSGGELIATNSPAGRWLGENRLLGSLRTGEHDFVMIDEQNRVVVVGSAKTLGKLLEAFEYEKFEHVLLDKRSGLGEDLKVVAAGEPGLREAHRELWGEAQEVLGGSPTLTPAEATIEVAPSGTAADATVQEMAARLHDLAQMSDGDLARLFPGQVHRETFQRWRTGRLTNPTPANRRRFGLVLRLLEDLDQRGARVADWLRNPTPFDDQTPYDLLVQGRVDEVEHLAARAAPPVPVEEIITAEGRSVAPDAVPSFALRSDEPVRDLIFERDDSVIELEDDIDDD